MSSTAIIDVEQQFSVGLYSKRPLAIVRGSGARLYDAEGRSYIDCVGGQGAANLGHAHAGVTAAVQAQAAQLISCPEIFHNDQRSAYLQELAAALPFAANIFLCNSGAEAVEAAIKFARLLTGRATVVAAMRGFHGRTFGALSATWEPKYREPFMPLVPEYRHVPYGRIDALEAAVDAGTAAVLLEPVQGEGGVRPAPDGYLAQAQEICRRHGALLLVDEVQTGFGRCGSLFAIEAMGVEPDILILAKSIAAGLPMGATVLHARHGKLPAGSHGTTFGGNPLVCAAARAALQAYRAEALPQRAAELGERLRSGLRALSSPLIREVRGMGLLNGIELKERAQPFISALIDEGVLALPAGPNVLRLLPPLVISGSDIDAVIAAVGRVLDKAKA
jgi:acetylornithine/LysW-gamma-L-lysine aminotransferase